MKYRYIGRCAQGFVQFTGPKDTVVMPQGEAVEVPEWLAGKLANNSHFEKVEDGKFPGIYLDDESAPSVVIEGDAIEGVKVRKKPGPKPKVKPEEPNDTDRSEDRDAQEA